MRESYIQNLREDLGLFGRTFYQERVILKMVLVSLLVSLPGLGINQDSLLDPFANEVSWDIIECV